MTNTILFAALMMVSGPVIVVTGQSLSAGDSATPAVSAAVVGSNKTVAGLVNGATGTPPPTMDAFPFGDLIEASIESPRSGIGNYFYTLTGTSVFVVSGSKNASVYTAIKRGTVPFENMERMLESASARAGHKCIASVLIHGESDHAAGTSRAQYTANVVEFQSDIRAKCNAVGSGSGVPMFVSQMSSWTDDWYAGTNTTSVIPLAVYDAARQNSGTVVLVQPFYNWTHAADGLHLTNTSSRSMGAKFGQAIAFGPSWQPLWPRLSSPVERTTNVITVYLYTPFPPLVVDTTNITGVSATTRGFEYTDDSSPPSITAVDCSAACSGNTCSCQITLSGTPTGANKKLRYAYTGTDNNAGGPTSGPRGNIRDSDTATWQGAALYNWLVHFEESVL